MTSLVTARRASGFLRALPGRSAFPEAGVMGGHSCRTCRSEYPRRVCCCRSRRSLLAGGGSGRNRAAVPHQQSGSAQCENRRGGANELARPSRVRRKICDRHTFSRRAALAWQRWWPSRIARWPRGLPNQEGRRRVLGEKSAAVGGIRSTPSRFSSDAGIRSQPVSPSRNSKVSSSKRVG